MASTKARSRFQADMKSATELRRPGFSNIRKGDAEDEFTFTFTHSSPPEPVQLEIRVQPQEIQSYPKAHFFLTYTNNDVPPAVARVLENSMQEIGIGIEVFLCHLSRELHAALETDKPKADKDLTTTDTDEAKPDKPKSNEPKSEKLKSNMRDMDDSDDGDISFEYGDDVSEDNFFDDDDDNDDRFGIATIRAAIPSQSIQPLSPLLLQRMRRDLQSVLQAGFHTGRVYGFEDDKREHAISISIRVSKLGLSKETREAWDLDSSEYIVLLVQYSQGYNTFEDIIEGHPKLSGMRFCLRKCPRRKPSPQQAATAFLTEIPSRLASEGPELLHTIVSKSIDEFMNNEFISLLKIRNYLGVSWDSAKEEYHSRLFQSPAGFEDMTPGETTTPREPNSEAQLPPFIAIDHLSSDGEKSLPLLAMQFALRYLVRCTDYCTVCHRKVKGNFEALRPYVCSQPLCLYQYMNLGLGPSIEYEIINRPHVVDLLISFCFASLGSSVYGSGGPGIREFPTGLGLQVPKIRMSGTSSPPPGLDPSSTSGIFKTPWIGGPHLLRAGKGELVDPIEVIFDWDKSTAIITKEDNDITLSEGQWVVISTEMSKSIRDPRLAGATVLHHACIESIVDSAIKLSVASRHTMPNFLGRVIQDAEDCQYALPKDIRGHLVLYNDDLDDISNPWDKALSMMIVLTALPSVTDMRSYLIRSQAQDLSKWHRMTRASVDLLRWIIASNRSFIVQVDDTRPRERIGGVSGWMQFRFVQGSPEKEELFNEALKEVHKPQKTILAWHGSALENWHSIVRQGLNYNVTANGRAFGDGIYFSRDFDTSRLYGNPTLTTTVWPRSALNVRAAISLNELVNLPSQFVSCYPHFVVQQCHWTQCRYLFIQVQHNETRFKELCGGTGNKAPDEHSQIPRFIQDPEWTAKGPKRAELFIPQYAIPSAQAGLDVTEGWSATDTGECEMDSSDEDEDDLEFLSHEDDVSSAKLLKCESDFRPGTLDFSTLPQLEPPSYASNMAQKALALELKKLEKTQSSTPLHQLGWYIDFEKINNLFQWIVELHSFDPSLPLSRDMKTAGITSIVLEVRFLGEFPMSPPFVRVISPRFLPFVQGGGGHVTAGGAMCMELLTNSGWSPANNIESVLLQVRMAICSVDPRPARLERRNGKQYGIREAIEAYFRAAAVHGWEVPNDFRNLSS